MKEVLDNNPIKLKFADNEIKKGLLIGKTKGIIFLLDGHRVEAVPITTFLKEFELGAKQKIAIVLNVIPVGDGKFTQVNRVIIDNYTRVKCTSISVGIHSTQVTAIILNLLNMRTYFAS